MLEIDALLEQESWARRLARALVLDHDEAEEVVQEARLAWWRRPPRDASRARSWLGTVVRNAIRNRRRTQRRRLDLLGQAAPQAGPTPSAEALAEQLEVHRELAHSVAQLPEPFRQVVLLRYYEGLSAAEIARQLQVPAGTVRWRLKTGLDRLREALDARYRERRAWLILLAPLSERADAPSLPEPAPLVVVTAVALLAGALGFAGWQAYRMASGERPAGARAEAEGASGGPGAPSRPPRLTATGAALATDGIAPGEETAIPGWAQLEVADPTRIAGRVVSRGNAVRGARLRLSSGMLASARHVDRHTFSDANGAFSFGAQAPTNWFLTVTAPGLEPATWYLDLRMPAPRSRPGGQPVGALSIELRPCRVFARGVVRESGGGGLPAARVRLAAAWNNGGVEVSADRAGRYEICLSTATDSMPQALVAEADGYGAVETAAPGEASVIDFVLEPQALVSGRAVRDRGGEPVAGAQVTLLPTSPADPNRPPASTTQPVRLGATTDERGRFEITGLAAGRFKLNVGHDETAFAGAPTITVKPGEVLRDLEVRLQPVAIVDGRVVRDGVAAANAHLVFKRRVSGGEEADAGWTLSGQDGRFRVRLAQGAVVDRIVTPDPTRNGAWSAALAPVRLVVDKPRMTAVTIELPPESTAAELATAVTPAGAAAPRPLTTREARFGDLVRVLGYDLSGERIARGGQLVVTIHFEALGDLTGWQLFTHLVGPRGFRNLDHVPVTGAYPVSRWRPGETIRDRFVLPVGATFAPGAYTWYLGFWNGGDGAGRRLPVTPRAQQDGSDRMLAFTFTVE